MSLKGDKSRVEDRTSYEKNYTKIFRNWVETRTSVPKQDKKERLRKT